MPLDILAPFSHDPRDDDRACLDLRGFTWQATRPPCGSRGPTYTP